MEKEALKRIFEYIEKKENLKKPFVYKLAINEPFTEDDLNVKGNLYFPNSKKITSLPKGLKVEGDLSLANTRIRTLPEGLEVGGWLSIEDTSISKIPKGLKVGGSLIISHTSIGILPKGLEVGGIIYAIDSRIFNIEEIPKGVITEAIVTTNKLLVNPNLTISGNLRLPGTNITSLPKGLKVGGDLVLYNLRLKSLPEGLKVGGNLDLRNCKQLTLLPEGLEVNGDLYIRSTPLSKRSDQYLAKYIKGKIIR